MPDEITPLSAANAKEFFERVAQCTSGPDLVALYGLEVVPYLKAVVELDLQPRHGPTILRIGLAFVVGLLSWLVLQSPLSLPVDFFPIWMLTVSLLTAGYALYTIPKKERRARSSASFSNALWAIKGMTDVRCVGSLVDVLYSPYSELREAAGAALTRLLPEITPDNQDLLSLFHRSFLYSKLGSMSLPVSSELKVAITHMAAELVDFNAIGYVNNLAFMDAPAREKQHLKEVARKCLAEMEKRIDWNSVPDARSQLDDLKLEMQSTVDMGLYYEQGKIVVALCHQLPRLQPQDRHKLSKSQRDTIHALLQRGAPMASFSFTGYGRRTELLIACLKAVMQMRDTDALPVVRTLAHSEAATQNERTIRTAAREALAILEEEARKETVSGVLLRASTGPQSSPSELLRAAQGQASTTEPQELLRAHTDGKIAYTAEAGKSTHKPPVEVVQGRSS